MATQHWYIKVVDLSDKRDMRVFFFLPQLLTKKYSVKVIIPLQVLPVSAKV